MGQTRPPPGATEEGSRVPTVFLAQLGPWLLKLVLENMDNLAVLEVIPGPLYPND